MCPLGRLACPLEPTVRFILDGTVVRGRLYRDTCGISLLIVIGGRVEGQKVLFATGESIETWRLAISSGAALPIDVAARSDSI
jgi:hypothetical protein